MYLPSSTARNEIPPKMILAAMRAAARYEGMDWTIIVGQMYQETKYGQDPSAAPGGKNSAGYMGILQFGHPAWKDYGDDGNGDADRDQHTDTYDKHSDGHGRAHQHSDADPDSNDHLHPDSVIKCHTEQQSECQHDPDSHAKRDGGA